MNKIEFKNLKEGMRVTVNSSCTIYIVQEVTKCSSNHPVALLVGLVDPDVWMWVHPSDNIYRVEQKLFKFGNIVYNSKNGYERGVIVRPPTCGIAMVFWEKGKTWVKTDVKVLVTEVPVRVGSKVKTTKPLKISVQDNLQETLVTGTQMTVIAITQNGTHVLTNKHGEVWLAQRHELEPIEENNETSRSEKVSW